MSGRSHLIDARVGAPQRANNVGFAVIHFLTFASPWGRGIHFLVQPLGLRAQPPLGCRLGGVRQATAATFSAGSCITNVEPRPNVLCTETLPPCASTR